MDADLQDDIEAIEKMVDAYKDGADIVYGVRSSRKRTLFSRGRVLPFLQTDGYAHGKQPCRLQADEPSRSGRTVKFRRGQPVLKGHCPDDHLPTATVYYERGERAAGESKYPLKKMISFAFEGITSLSIKPIEIIIKLGLLLSVIGIGIIIYSIVQHFLDNTNAGWTSIIASIWMLGGLQLVAIGVIGKYIGKIYLETKHRPRYIIEKTTMDEK